MLSHLKIQLTEWHSKLYNLDCTYSLLVGHMVLLLMVLAVGRVDKRESAAIALLAAGLGLVLQ